jgi:preprotein translocase subunit SecF
MVLRKNHSERRNKMEGATNEKMENNVKQEGKGKRTWGSRIFNFLAYGGFMLVLVAIVVIIIVISLLTR